MFDQEPKNCLAGWYFSSEEIDNALRNGHMLNPSIDLTNACNLNCPYCYIEEKNSRRKVRRPNELSHQETLAVIDDLISCGAKTINIVGAGEPTIDPHFEQTIEHIASRRLATVVFTNGIRLANDSALVNFLHSRQVTIVLKYNSAKSLIEDAVVGRIGYSSKKEKALDTLIDAGFTAEEPTRLGVDAVAFRGNLEELPHLHNHFRHKNIYTIIAEYIPTGRTEGGLFQGFLALSELENPAQQRVTDLLQPITSSERNHLLHQLREIDLQFGIRRPLHFAYFGGGICTQILGLYVDIQGHIWPCVARAQKTAYGMVSGLLGNFRAGDRPSTIWKQHEYMKYIRLTFTGGCPYKPELELV